MTQLMRKNKKTNKKTKKNIQTDLESQLKDSYEANSGHIKWLSNKETCLKIPQLNLILCDSCTW